MRERQIEARERNAKEMEAALGFDGKKSLRSWRCFFSVSHRFWLMLKEFVKDDAFYIHLKLFFGYSDIEGAIRIATDFFFCTFLLNEERF